MAEVTVTDTDQEVYTSTQGSATNPDAVIIRLAPSTTGTVYIERSDKQTPADPDTSFFITDSESYSASLVAGETLHAITATGSIPVRVDALVR